MAEKPGVWGIDIGQAGLKALRLQYVESADQVFATAFDYVPHPKILSQPDAIPEELIPQALEQFLSRNDLKDDLVAISVPGQSALARFIQLPPVESSKISEIVKYEAKQQIPFALEDVIWDYQTLGGGTEESGFMLEAEVGLFAMKREQVVQHLKPFADAGVEVELIQIAPLALYNFLSYDQLGVRPGDDTIAMDEYMIVLDMGADNTMLLVSNGEKIWIRNVPLGGNHFTRALTKEMKLTFAKAEHLKCNATKSPDPRSVFQALRPVFNDYVSEIQRSIGYFSSVNRDAKIGKIVGLGNGFKLAGLQKFLQQNLQYEVDRVDKFSAIAGDSVLSAPLFQENVMSFAVPYGLALQGLKQTRIHTSLLPPEIATARTIRRKKPWAVSAAAMLLFGLAVSSVAFAFSWRAVSTERFGGAESEVNSLTTKIGQQRTAYEEANTQHANLKRRGESLVKILETREYWMELFKAVNECLPRDVGDQKDQEDIQLKNRLQLTSTTAQRAVFKDWFEDLQQNRIAMEYIADSDKQNPPPGKGYVVTLTGVSFHHDERDEYKETGQRELYINEYFLKKLQQEEVHRSGSPPVPVGQIGISHATIVDFDVDYEYEYYPDGPPVDADPFGPQRPGFDGRRGDDDEDEESGRSGINMRGNYKSSAFGRLGDRLRRRQQNNNQANVKLIPATYFTIEFAWRPGKGVLPRQGGSGGGNQPDNAGR